MKIDETLKSNLITDVEHTIGLDLKYDQIESLKRAFEITIGHALSSLRDDKEEKPITRNEVKDLINSKDAIYGPGNKGYSNEPLPIDYAKIFCFLTEDEIKAMAPYSGKSCNEHWIEGYKKAIQDISSQAQSSPQPRPGRGAEDHKQSDIDDLVQFVTNLIYSAYKAGTDGTNSITFDQWHEEQMSVIAEYYKSHLSPVQSIQSVKGERTDDYDLIKSSWSIKYVLMKLVEAADILLHKKDYDGHGWEEIHICYKRGLEIIRELKESRTQSEGKDMYPEK